MKKILLFLLFLPSLLFAQNQGGVIIVGGVAVHQPDTSAYKVINTIQAEGTQLNGNNRFYVTYLVALSKRDSLWHKSKAFYGFIGGTSASHKWNWKDMRDVDGAYRLVFTGGVTHSSNGIQGDGSTGYANTFIVPSTVHNTTTGATITYYIKTPNNVPLGSFGSIDNAGGGANQKNYFIIDRPNLFGLFNADYTATSSIQPNKFVLSSVKKPISGAVIQNNRLTNTINSIVGSSLLPNSVFTLLGRNESGGSLISISSTFLNHEINFFSDSDYLTDQQAIQASKIITFAQGILGRK